MFNWFFDPRLFNFLILGLYGCNILRWAIEGKLADTVYWLGAFIITSAVTFGYNH
jgi:hypothetical protein